MAEEKASISYQIENLPVLLSIFNNHLELNKSLDFLETLPRSINTRNYGKLVHYYEEICDIFCVPPNPKVQKVLSKKPPVDIELNRGFTWNDLKGIDSDLHDRIREKAQEYGYD